MDCESCLRFGPRLREPPEARQSRRQERNVSSKNSCSLRSTAEPGDRLLLLAEVKFGDPREHAPQIGMGVAGTEAQRPLDMSLGVLWLAEAKLAVADLRVRGSQIAIQLQRPLALLIRLPAD